jgi:glycosyltransferase involved in cell wall biosynthesis
MTPVMAGMPAVPPLETAFDAPSLRPSAFVLRATVALCASGELFGGVEQFVAQYALYLKRETLIRPVVILLEEGRLFRKLQAEGVDVEVVPLRHRYDMAAVRKIQALFRRHGVDMVHVHGYKATVLAGWAARRAGLRTVKTEHGALEPRRGWPALKMRLNLWADRWATRGCVDRVVYVTEDLRRRAPRPIRETGVVIHNGLAALPDPEPGRPEELQRPGFKLGIIGRLSPVKGHRILFQALNKARARPDLRVFVIGEGPLERELRQEARALGIDGQVSFLGFRSDARRYMAHLDAFVMPSLHEGLPYTLLEAMALRVPVVASAAGGLKEVLTHGQTALLCRPGDPTDLASQIDALVLDPGLRDRLAANGSRLVHESFGITHMADQYIGIYKELAEEKPGLRWLTWQRHRRTVQLARRLKARLHVFEPVPGLHPAWTWLRTVAHLLTRRSSVLVVQNPSLLLTATACFLKRWTADALIVDLHSYFSLHIDRARGLRNRLYQKLSRYCLRRADLTIVTNEELRRVVGRYGGRGRVLQDALPRFPGPGRRPRVAAFQVVFVSSFSADEPMEDVFKAAEDFDPAEFRLYVTGRPDRAARERPLPACVELTGFLDEADYLALLNSADALLTLTTREHTLLCGAYEGIALGKPLIISDKKALRDYFTRGVVYVDNTASGIAAGLRQAARERARLEHEIQDLSQDLAQDWDRRFARLTDDIQAWMEGRTPAAPGGDSA